MGAVVASGDVGLAGGGGTGLPELVELCRIEIGGAYVAYR